MKILYVTTIAKTMPFFTNVFKRLNSDGHTVELACNCEGTLPKEIEKFGFKVYDLSFSRSPFSLSNFKAYEQLKNIVTNNRYDIVHCHTPNAAAITRLACIKARKSGTKVIYTAHGFHFYKGSPYRNWLIYYTVEKVCSHWTDVLITINTEDYNLAQARLSAGRIEYVPGVGIDLNKFAHCSIDKSSKRAELGIPVDVPLLLSVGELNQNKNHEMVIQAISGLDVYYLIAGIGDHETKLKQVAKEAGMEERVRLLGYRVDVDELLVAADMFVFPSFREGLSVSLMETMASGRPAVVSRIRGNVDLIDENGGALFNPYILDECRSAILKVMSADRTAMGEYNKQKVKGFALDVVLEKINSIYKETLMQQ